MTEQLKSLQDLAKVQPVTTDENTPEFLKKLAEKLENDGEAYVQTDENVGAEEPVTVH